jgi:hypothetical protein
MTPYRGGGLYSSDWFCISMSISQWPSEHNGRYIGFRLLLIEVYK